MVNILEDPDRTNRLSEIEERLESIEGQVRQEDYRSNSVTSDRFIHARSLEIQKQDGQCFKILFDKGMNFLKKSLDQRYEIKEPTYVVITRRT
jgi:hypothetical protein